MGNVWAVLKFELRSSLTIQRTMWWCFLLGFPIFITSLIRAVPGNAPREGWSIFLFALLPMLIGMLGTFLWTAPAVSAELERQSWVYLAVRPGGRTANLLGKYLAAICWVLPAALISMTVCVTIASGEVNHSSLMAEGSGDSASFQLWFALFRLTLFATTAYAALYLLLGTLFTKRAMVLSVIYTLIFELAVSMVPAVVNKLTIQYRLRALLLDWTDIDVNNQGQWANFLSTELIGNSPAIVHVTVLFCYTAALLFAAVWVIRHREYATNSGGDG